MKIEFIEEVKVNGESRFFTEIDGSYVSDSLSLNRDTAYRCYQRIKISAGTAERKVLETTEIETATNQQA